MYLIGNANVEQIELFKKILLVTPCLLSLETEIILFQDYLIFCTLRQLITCTEALKK